MTKTFFSNEIHTIFFQNFSFKAENLYRNFCINCFGIAHLILALYRLLLSLGYHQPNNIFIELISNERNKKSLNFCG